MAKEIPSTEVVGLAEDCFILRIVLNRVELCCYDLTAILSTVKQFQKPQIRFIFTYGAVEAFEMPRLV